MVMDPEQEPSGNVRIAVVDPGSANDPFTASGRGASAGPAATGIVVEPGSQPATGNEPASTPAAADLRSAGLTEDAIKALLEPMVATRISGIQSTYDRKLHTLQGQLDQASEEMERREEEAIRRERDALTRGMTDAERAQHLKAWEAEDTARALEKKEGAVLDLYKAVEGMRLLEAYKGYGITEDDVVNFGGSPVDMEDHIKGLAFDRLRSGGATPSQATAAVTAAAAKAEPAGASAAQDLGSTPASVRQDGLVATPGLDSMAQNVKKLFSEGANLPW